MRAPPRRTGSRRSEARRPQTSRPRGETWRTLSGRFWTGCPLGVSLGHIGTVFLSKNKFLQLQSHFPFYGSPEWRTTNLWPIRLFFIHLWKWWENHFLQNHMCSSIVLSILLCCSPEGFVTFFPMKLAFLLFLGSFSWSDVRSKVRGVGCVQTVKPSEDHL